MVENLPNGMRNICVYIQEAYQTPSKINLKRFTPRYIDCGKTGQNLEAGRQK